MPTYSDFIERLFLQPKVLEELCPDGPLMWDLPDRIRKASDADISGGKPVENATAFSLVRGGLHYLVDALDPAHEHFQEVSGGLGAYWHGMMHRREGDFENARYWFRRAGSLPFFQSLHREAMEHSGLMGRQSTWDPYLFTGECERARRGRETPVELARLQRAEWDVIFDYTWRQALEEA